MRLFCPTGQRLFARRVKSFRKIRKPLIPLMPSTVHGVVFDILVFDGTKAAG